MNSSIISINIPSQVIKIGEYAFFGCENLKIVEMPVNLKIKTIEKRTFYECKTIESITIPSHVTHICKKAFTLCQSLREIIIPENSELQQIGYKAFNRTLIEKFSIPSKLVKLDVGWCFYMKHLNDINVSEDNKCFMKYNNEMILRKSSIEKEEFNVLVFVFKQIENLIIPDFIEIIEPDAFLVSAIKYITIPSNVTNIRNYAFSKCSNLDHVEFSKDSKLQKIEQNAFSYSSINSSSTR